MEVVLLPVNDMPFSIVIEAHQVDTVIANDQALNCIQRLAGQKLAGSDLFLVLAAFAVLRSKV